MLLERLAQDLNGCARHLREFIKEENAAVCQRNFARGRLFSAACKSLRRHRVMRSTEGPLPADTLSFGKHSGDAVDPRYFHLLLLRHRRHDRRNPPCDHGFSAARRPQHQQIVKSGRSDKRRPPRRRLALHFGKVRLFSVLLLLIFYRRKRRHFPFTAVVQKLL